MRIRLSDADRERFGVPEFLPVPLATVTNREAVALQKLGYPTPGALARALDAGAKSGETDYIAVTALVWLALRREGVQVEFDDLEFDVWQFSLAGDEEPAAAVVVDAGSGKATGRGGSTSSRRPRSTSGATSKRKSTPTGSPS